MSSALFVDHQFSGCNSSVNWDFAGLRKTAFSRESMVRGVDSRAFPNKRLQAVAYSGNSGDLPTEYW